jgi:hypothetical protein
MLKKTTKNKEKSQAKVCDFFTKKYRNRRRGCRKIECFLSEKMEDTFGNF